MSNGCDDAAPQSSIRLLGALLRHVSRRRRIQFCALVGLTLLSSAAEVISIGSVLPFVGILVQPEKAFNSPSIAMLANAMNIHSGPELVVPLAIAFAIAALLAGAFRLIMLYASIRLGNSTGADLSISVFLRTLCQPYSIHVARSSSEIIAGITQKVATATSVLISLVALITSSILFVAILSTLLLVDPLVATVAATSFGAAYGLVAWSARRRLSANSQIIADGQSSVVKALQEGLGAIRDVLLDGTQKIYCAGYRSSVLRLQRAGGENTFINQAPRFVMEAMGMCLITMFVLLMSQRPGGMGAALPLLALLALGAQRLLPLMQIIYGNWSVVAGNVAALNDVVKLLDQPLPDDLFHEAEDPMPLRDSIELKNVYFRYDSNSDWVLKNLTLRIPRGGRVGFIGPTGSGKSTALDLLMLLLAPDCGEILIDGTPITGENARRWQRNIAHVPQFIFLSDASIRENIAFGCPLEQIDDERVRRAAAQADIAGFIESRAGGYDAVVGERGVRVSGGQRQRIGIARALYKRSSVLVFDEATSALDHDTEESVMQAIEGLSKDLTVIIIAHRTSTLRHCDIIFRLEHGQVVQQGSYADLVGAEQH